MTEDASLSTDESPREAESPGVILPPLQLAPLKSQRLRDALWAPEYERYLGVGHLEDAFGLLGVEIVVEVVVSHAVPVVAVGAVADGGVVEADRIEGHLGGEDAGIELVEGGDLVVVGQAAEHVALAREAARKSVVLLKNDGILPLAPEIRQLYVTGPFAGSTEVLLGNYHGLSPELVTVLEGIAGKVSAGTTLTYNFAFPPRWKTGPRGQGRRQLR